MSFLRAERWKKSYDSDDDNSNYDDNGDSNSHNDNDNNNDNNGDDCNHSYDNGIIEKIMILTVTIMILVSQDFSTSSRCTYVRTYIPQVKYRVRTVRTLVTGKP